MVDVKCYRSDDLSEPLERLYQWDTGIIMVIKNLTTLTENVKVYYTNLSKKSALMVIPDNDKIDVDNKKFEVSIPDILLTEPGAITAYIYDEKSGGHGTTYCARIPVAPMVKSGTGNVYETDTISVSGDVFANNFITPGHVSANSITINGKDAATKEYVDDEISKADNDATQKAANALLNAKNYTDSELNIARSDIEEYARSIFDTADLDSRISVAETDLSILRDELFSGAGTFQNINISGNVFVEYDENTDTGKKVATEEYVDEKDFETNLTMMNIVSGDDLLPISANYHDVDDDDPTGNGINYTWNNGVCHIDGDQESNAASYNLLWNSTDGIPWWFVPGKQYQVKVAKNNADDGADRVKLRFELFDNAGTNIHTIDFDKDEIFTVPMETDSVSISIYIDSTVSGGHVSCDFSAHIHQVMKFGGDVYVNGNSRLATEEYSDAAADYRLDVARDEYTSIYGQRVPVEWERGNIDSNGNSPIIGRTTKWMRTKNYIDLTFPLAVAMALNNKRLTVQVFYYSLSGEEYTFINKDIIHSTMKLLTPPEGATHCKLHATTYDYQTSDGITSATLPLYSKRVWVTYASNSLLKIVTEEIANKADETEASANIYTDTKIDTTEQHFDEATNTIKNDLSILKKIIFNPDEDDEVPLSWKVGFLNNSTGEIDTTKTNRIVTTNANDGFIVYSPDYVVINYSPSASADGSVSGYICLYNDSYEYIATTPLPGWSNLRKRVTYLSDYSSYNPAYFRITLQKTSAQAFNTIEELSDYIFLFSIKRPHLSADTISADKVLSSDIYTDEVDAGIVKINGIPVSESFSTEEMHSTKIETAEIDSNIIKAGGIPISERIDNLWLYGDIIDKDIGYTAFIQVEPGETYTLSGRFTSDTASTNETIRKCRVSFIDADSPVTTTINEIRLDEFLIPYWKDEDEKNPSITFTIPADFDASNKKLRILACNAIANCSGAKLAKLTGYQIKLEKGAKQTEYSDEPEYSAIDIVARSIASSALANVGVLYKDTNLLYSEGTTYLQFETSPTDTRNIIISASATHSYEPGTPFIPIDVRLYDSISSVNELSILNNTYSPVYSGELKTYYLSTGNEINKRFAICEKEEDKNDQDKVIGWVDSCHIPKPKICLSYVNNNTIVMLGTSFCFSHGSGYKAIKQYRMPPAPPNANNMRLTITVPNGCTVSIEEILAEYNDYVNRTEGGIEIDTHGGLFQYPEHSSISMEMAAKCGSTRFITIPKRSKDGVWFAYHDDILCLQDYSGYKKTKLRNTDGTAIVYFSGSEYDETEIGYYHAKRFYEIDFPLLESLDWGTRLNISTKTFVDDIYIGTKPMLIDDMFKTCARTGMKPMFSLHPYERDRLYDIYIPEAASLKALSDRHNITQRLTLKTANINHFTDAMFQVFGDSVEKYATTIAQSPGTLRGTSITESNCIPLFSAIIKQIEGLENVPSDSDFTLCYKRVSTVSNEQIAELFTTRTGAGTSESPYVYSGKIEIAENKYYINRVNLSVFVGKKDDESDSIILEWICNVTDIGLQNVIDIYLSAVSPTHISTAGKIPSIDLTPYRFYFAEDTGLIHFCREIKNGSIWEKEWVKKCPKTDDMTDDDYLNDCKAVYQVLDKSKVMIELFAKRVTPERIKRITNAGFQAGVASVQHTGADGNTHDYIEGDDYEYYTLLGASEFTSNKQVSVGLNW